MLRSNQLSYIALMHSLQFGSPGRARTADLVVNSHPLYRLSYRGIVYSLIYFNECLAMPGSQVGLPERSGRMRDTIR